MNRRSEAGTQIVEFAVVLPVIILLALVAAEGTNLFRVHQLVTNAAREGARLSINAQDYYIVVNQTSNAGLTNPQTCTFASPSTKSKNPVCQDVANYLQYNKQVGSGYMQCGSLSVTVAQNYAPPNDSGNQHYSQVQVGCSYQLRYLPRLPFYSIPNSLVIRRDAVLRNLYN